MVLLKLINLLNVTGFFWKSKPLGNIDYTDFFLLTIPQLCYAELFFPPGK